MRPRYGFLKLIQRSLHYSSWTSHRVLRPEDSNASDTVHGAVVLKMLEEAGRIVSMRHCNSRNGDSCFAALGRIEQAHFLSPMFAGELAHTTAEITYTSKHSLEVQAQVVAENPITGSKRLANKASLWYVPCSLQDLDKVMEVPPIQYSAEQEAEGRRRYEAQKDARLEAEARAEEMVPPPLSPEPHTVGFSQTSVMQYLCYPDYMLHDYIDGGLIMRIMDETAGIVSSQHYNKKCNPVTASLHNFNFQRKIKKGSVLTVTGRVTFVSAKSMEVEVIADSCAVLEGDKTRYRTASAFFNYVVWDNGPLPLPPLKIKGEDEQRRFEEGEARYLQRKAKRLAEKESR